MPVKKRPHSKQTKQVLPKDAPVGHIPDIFDEEGTDASVIPSQRSARTPLVVEVEDIQAEVTQIPENGANDESDLPAPTAPPAQEEETFTASQTNTSPIREPSFTVRANGQEIEPKLPSFFAENSRKVETVADEQVSEHHNVVPVASMSAPQSEETKVLEAIVPQAFVGEVREVAKEVKQEKKSALVTFFIILGMLLVAGGVIALYILGTKKADGPSATPAPTPIVEATPNLTPTVIVNTATPSGELTTPTTDLKVNVFNGTAIKGLAAKEAAVLKKAGYTIGNVGNGDPTKAGTITVPTGETAVAQGIQAALADFTFTVTEDAKATSITIVLDEPTE